MGQAAGSAYIRLEDYFEAEVGAAADAPKHEWFDGVVYAMSRGTPEYGRLTSRATIAATRYGNSSRTMVRRDGSRLTSSQASSHVLGVISGTSPRSSRTWVICGSDEPDGLAVSARVAFQPFRQQPCLADASTAIDHDARTALGQP